MNQTHDVPTRHVPRRVVALYIAVAILCVALVGFASWWYFFENPNAGSIAVQVRNSTPANESGMAEVWVAVDGPANESGNSHLDALSIAPTMTDQIVFSVSGEACQPHSVSLYLNVGPYPESHAVSTQSVTVCGGEQKTVTFTVTNTF